MEPRGMRLILPAFFQTSGEGELALRAGGLETMRHLRDVSPVVITNMDEIAVACAGLNLPCLHRRALGEDLIRDVPPGLSIAMESAIEHGWLTPDDPCFVADCRNPLLSDAHLSSALALSRRNGGAPVFSVSPPRDHPCQCRHPFVIKSLDLFVGQDADWACPALAARRTAATQPFEFPWSRCFAQRPGPSRLYVVSGDRAELTPWEALEGMELVAAILEDGGETPILYWESDGLARRVLVEEAARTWPLGAMLPATRRPSSLSMLARREANDAVSVFLAGEAEEGEHLCVLPADQDDPTPRLTPIRRDAKEILRLGEKLFCGPAAELPTAPVGALTLIRLRPAGAVSDYDHPVGGAETPWFTSMKTGELVNALTGAVITGRQQFPEVYAPDGVLAYCAAKEASRMGELMASGSARCLRLENNALIVRDEVDLLRLEARREGVKEERDDAS